MIAKLEALLVQSWYSSNNRVDVLSFCLTPLSWIFALVAGFRFRYQRRKLSRVANRDIKPLVVVIGNITVGGTGKTPLIIYLASALSRRGLRVGIVSRGHGGSYLHGGGAAQRVKPDDSGERVGDEPLAIVRALSANIGSDIPVVVSKRRVEGVELLLQQQALDIVLSDDGLQHYALPRDLEYVVVDGQRGFGNARLLPAGPLREAVTRLRSVDMVVINGQSKAGLEHGIEQSNTEYCHITVEAFGARRLADTEQPVEDLAEVLSRFDIVCAVAGIGNPARFFDALASCTADLNNKRPKLFCSAYPDHHQFSLSDLEQVIPAAGSTSSCAIFITEKDAVKCITIASQLTVPVYVVGTHLTASDALVQPILLAQQQLAGSS